MTHLEAQSNIMPFIEGKVPRDKQADFVIHMRNCKKCREELEIYYTLMVGMRQLDNNEALSTDFNKDLEKDLRTMSHGVRNRRSFKLSAFSILFALGLLIVTISYFGILAQIYDFEQFTKKTEQGTYYFHSELDDNMMLGDIDHIQVSNNIDKEKELTDYDRINGFRRLEENYDEIISIGESIQNVETTTD